MTVKATHKISDHYYVGDDRQIWRLGYISKSGQRRKAKPIKKNRDGYYFETKYVKKEDIVFLPCEPFTIYETPQTPFL